MAYPRGPAKNVTVTQDHIDKGIPRDSGYCMIAEAIKSTIPWASWVSVDLQTIRFTDLNRKLRFTYLTPRSCQEVLADWDDGIKPEPWTFKLKEAHVTRAGRYKPKSAEQAARDNAARRHRSKPVPDLPRRRTIAPRGNDLSGNVSEVVGGHPPPVSINRRRAFGLRSLRR